MRDGFIHKSVTAIPLNWASVVWRRVCLIWYQVHSGDNGRPSPLVTFPSVSSVDWLGWSLTSESSQTSKSHEHFEVAQSELKLISVWAPLFGKLNPGRGTNDCGQTNVFDFIFNITWRLLLHAVLLTARWNCSELNIVLQDQRTNIRETCRRTSEVEAGSPVCQYSPK